MIVRCHWTQLGQLISHAASNLLGSGPRSRSQGPPVVAELAAVVGCSMPQEREQSDWISCWQMATCSHLLNAVLKGNSASSQRFMHGEASDKVLQACMSLLNGNRALAMQYNA